MCHLTLEYLFSRVLLVRRYDGAVLGYVSPPKPNGHATIQAKPEDALVMDVPTAQQYNSVILTRLTVRLVACILTGS